MLVFTFFIAANPIKAQSGWVAAQLNSGIGYSLYETDSVIFASTYDGVFSTTGDGMPWFSKGPANHVVYGAVQTNQSILAATADGIYRSSDKGTSWELIPNSPICSGVGATQGHQVFAKQGTSIFIHTWAQGVFRSDDDGKTWQLLTIGTRSGWGGDLGGWATSIFSFAGKLFVSAPADKIGIYYSTDNGDSWIPARSTDSSGAENLLFFAADHDTLYAGGFMGLYRSTDSGINWTPQYLDKISPEGQMIGLGIFRDLVAYKQNLIAAVDFHSLQLSRDGGKTWTEFNNGLISDWTFADLAIKAPYLWALTGFFGNAYRFELSELMTNNTAIVELSGTDLLGQNYPNPVRTTTTIKYTVQNTGKVTITVYDVYGKEAATLVNKTQAAGNYEPEFNLQHLKNGTYFYRLTCENQTETKKLLVIGHEQNF